MSFRYWSNKLTSPKEVMYEIECALWDLGRTYFSNQDRKDEYSAILHQMSEEGQDIDLPGYKGRIFEEIVLNALCWKEYSAEKLLKEACDSIKTINMALLRAYGDKKVVEKREEEQWSSPQPIEGWEEDMWKKLSPDGLGKGLVKKGDFYVKIKGSLQLNKITRFFSGREEFDGFYLKTVDMTKKVFSSNIDWSNFEGDKENFEGEVHFKSVYHLNGIHRGRMDFIINPPLKPEKKIPSGYMSLGLINNQNRSQNGLEIYRRPDGSMCVFMEEGGEMDLKGPNSSFRGTKKELVDKLEWVYERV